MVVRRGFLFCMAVYGRTVFLGNAVCFIAVCPRPSFPETGTTLCYSPVAPTTLFLFISILLSFWNWNNLAHEFARLLGAYRNICRPFGFPSLQGWLSIFLDRNFCTHSCSHLTSGYNHWLAFKHPIQTCWVVTCEFTTRKDFLSEIQIWKMNQKLSSWEHWHIGVTVNGNGMFISVLHGLQNKIFN